MHLVIVHQFLAMIRRVFLLMVILTVITVEVSSDKNSFHVNLLLTNNTTDPELEAYHQMMEVVPTILSRHDNNVSFRGMVEDLRVKLLNPRNVAIIGSGDPVVDGVASLFAECTGVPLINARNSAASLEVCLPI